MCVAVSSGPSLLTAPTPYVTKIRRIQGTMMCDVVKEAISPGVYELPDALLVFARQTYTLWFNAR